MMISIVSCPHTGTKFTEKMLMNMGYEVRCCHLNAPHPAQNAEAWVESGDKVVIPWRDPALSRISSRNRDQEPRPWSEFVQVLHWSELANVHLFDVEPGDDNEKDAELSKLQAFLEPEAVPLVPPATTLTFASTTLPTPVVDWAPVNVSEDVTKQKAAYVHGMDYGHMRGP